MNRLEEYCKLLEAIYGKRLVEYFTTKDENLQTLTMKNIANNQLKVKEFDRNEGEGCDICKNKFRNKDNFFKRNLEFPGWIGKLNFSENTHAKDIMIIGEAPPPLKVQINIAFGLGYFPIDDEGKLDFEQLYKTYLGEERRVEKIKKDQEKKNVMWKYMNLLFLKKLAIIKRKIYITDLCKCNDDIKSEKKNERKNMAIWKICRNYYLIKEIELINPKLIIFQGWNSYKFLKDYLIEENIISSEVEILEKVNKYYPKQEGPDYSETKLYFNPFYGTFPINENQIPFFSIFHQTNFTNRYKNKYDITTYTNRHSKFIENKILKEILKIS